MDESNYYDGDNGGFILACVINYLILISEGLLLGRAPLPQKLLISLVMDSMKTLYNFRLVSRYIDTIIMNKYLPNLYFELTSSNILSLNNLVNNSMFCDKFIKTIRHLKCDNKTIETVKSNSIFYNNANTGIIPNNISRLNLANLRSFKLNANMYDCYTNFMMDSIFDIFPSIKNVRYLAITFLSCMINLERYINECNFLERLELDGYNIKFSDDYKLLPSVKHIDLGKYNNPDIHKIFNNNMTFISLENYTHPLEYLPPKLKYLALKLYNYPNIDVILPNTLNTLLLGIYNHKITKKLPISLCNLVFSMYNHPGLEHVLPNKLQNIELYSYNYELTFLPDTVTYLSFGSYNHANIEYILPSNLKYLNLRKYTHPFLRRLPKTISTIKLSSYNHPGVALCLSENLKSLTMGLQTNQIMYLPETLRYLRLSNYNHPGVEYIIPYNVGVIHLPKYNHPFCDDYVFPNSVLVLNIKSYNHIGIEYKLPNKLNYLNLKNYAYPIIRSQLPKTLYVIKCFDH